MPFLTRDLPPGGRHVDRAVPPVAPVAPAAARLRQLIPVGLLVAASSAGVAVSPMLGGTSAVADAGHGAALHFPGTIPNPEASSSATQVNRTAYVISRDAGRHVAQDPADGTSSSVAAVTGGRHRADTAAGTPTAAATSTPKHAAPKHAASPATEAASVAQPGADTSSPGSIAGSSTGSSDTTSASAASTPSASATQQPDVLTGVGEVVGGVLGAVGGLLGGS